MVDAQGVGHRLMAAGLDPPGAARRDCIVGTIVAAASALVGVFLFIVAEVVAGVAGEGGGGCGG